MLDDTNTHIEYHHQQYKNLFEQKLVNIHKYQLDKRTNLRIKMVV